MAAAEVLGLLAELEHSLRSNPKEKITSEEELVFQNLKGSLVDTFLLGGVVSSLAAWKVTRQFSFAPRLLYSAGAAFLGGSWVCKWMLRSSLDPIFAADGSRMQRELANIMLLRHQEETLRRSFVNRYLCRLLFPEQVFVDSHPDKSFTRWRLRNSYEDHSNAEPTDNSLNSPHEEAQSPAKKLQRNPAREANAEHDNASEDPLGCILGYAGATHEIHPSIDDATQSRKLTRSNKRLHRRQRARARDRHPS